MNLDTDAYLKRKTYEAESQVTKGIQSKGGKTDNDEDDPLAFFKTFIRDGETQIELQKQRERM